MYTDDSVVRYGFDIVRIEAKKGPDILARFPGQWYEPHTEVRDPNTNALQHAGLHYNWHRYYDPNVGQYITPDPIGLAGGLNVYAYADNDPVNHIDPTGEVPVLPALIWAAKAVGKMAITAVASHYLHKAVDSCGRRNNRYTPHKPPGDKVPLPVPSSPSDVLDLLDIVQYYNPYHSSEKDDLNKARDTFQQQTRKLLPPRWHWNEDLLSGHYKMHAQKGNEWGRGNITQEAYRKRAIWLLRHPEHPAIKVHVTKKGYVFKWNTRTNEFVAADGVTGKVESFFRPKQKNGVPSLDKGMRYWEANKRRNP